MVTRRGWATLGAGGALVLLWILLGEIELLTAGVLTVLAVIVAVVLVRFLRPNLTVLRRLAPALVHEGDTAAVDVTLTNRGRRRIPDVTLVDQVGALGSASFQIGSLPRRRPVEASYRIVCRPRGVYTVGPAVVRVSDPLGLAGIDREVGAEDRLIVYPEVEDLDGFPVVRGRDPAMQASRPEFSRRGGEDFFTLREYVIGDDLRRVHWPTSAKRDELMIRQLETPWQSRALVLLDLRRRVYAANEDFEKAVRGAASVVRHLARSGFDADLWAGGVDATSVGRYTAAMEALATVQPVDRLDIRAVAAHLRRVGRGGALVLVTGAPDHDLLEVHRLMSREYRTTVLLSVGDAAGRELAFQQAGVITMHVTARGSWATAWSKGVNRLWHGVSAG